MTSMTLLSLPVEALRDAITGHVSAPGDPDFDDARRAWNLAVDQRPAAVAIPRTADDVVEIVRFANAHDLYVAPQASGHNVSPIASLQDTILLRTHELRGVEIDPVAKRARVAAGTEWKEVVGPASEYGLAALSGSSPQINVVGYTLGGGVGWLGRKYGLAANSVLAIEVVTADGQLRRIDADHDPDLFWALRGGGGNFGVVTAIEFALHDVGPLVAGLMLWPAERAPEVLHAWHELTQTAPDELTTSMRLLNVPDDPALPEALRGGSFIAIDGAFAGDEAAATAVLAPLRALEPMMDGWVPVAPGALSYVHMDPEDAMPTYGGTQMLGELPSEAIDEFLALAGPGSGSPLLMAELRHVGGALARPHAGHGATGTFDGEYLMYLGGVPIDADVATAGRAHIERVRSAMARWSTGREYLNFVEEPVDASTMFSPEAYPRLRTIRAEFDPDERFVANHRIPPA
ncbi:FAD-binding oxidoreductase [Capillimicrobium parvum]|uniref:Mitomycin radical oxidase n=1 Tax=Capillimicrobium parvum TaxID=2884022 RepID=A0A9E7BZ92_9ACTN|nr:FAD-binding oxidoreductase [Capillimicrobium parvum]UGS34319.1 Mitomycin radical oxidase [Capillimicrobium parvum]